MREVPLLPSASALGKWRCRITATPAAASPAGITRRHRRKDVLWERRFTSVIVEDVERALRTMAGYIDLNPVRAGPELSPGLRTTGGGAIPKLWLEKPGRGADSSVL